MNIRRVTLRRTGLAVLSATVLSVASVVLGSTAKAETTVEAVLSNYSNIAEAGYQDALSGAQALQAKISAFLKAPNERNLEAARAAWRASRVPYMQTEAYRFGNKIVDDWEGKVNAWPLDEGLIDYVDSAAYGTEHPENALFVSNVIANPTLKVGGKTVDASKITKAFLSETLHEAGGVEANVATGYHAIEFLLWGQDLNGTGAGAGKRPASDFDASSCTGGNCDRRAQYLSAVTELLIDDLDWMAKQWGKDGAARLAVTQAPGTGGIATIFTGLGSLSYGEMAGERIKLGLLLHDPEETHDCFSDNTHASHYYDLQGIQNVYLGSYTRTDGSTISGASVSDLVREKSADIDARIRSALDATMASVTALSERAEKGERVDQMIAQGNKAGGAVVMAVVDGLVAQTKEFERGIAVLKLNPIDFEGSDSLDEPEKIGGSAQ